MHTIYNSVDKTSSVYLEWMDCPVSIIDGREHLKYSGLLVKTNSSIGFGLSASILFDGKMFYSVDPNETIYQYGFIYKYLRHMTLKAAFYEFK